MKKIFTFTCILIVGLCGCRKQQQQEYAGVEGDTVNGTPLSQRQEGVSFFGNNVNRSQFQPVYFAFDSFEIQSSESIQTVSFGLEMPADPGHNESAWAKNRRVETGVVR